MQCRLPRKMSMVETPDTVTLTLSGAFSSKYGYVKINSKTYYEETTLTLNRGAYITVYVGTSSFTSDYDSVYITLNGETLIAGGAGDEGTISASVKIIDNCLIKMNRPRSNAYNATITMPYTG